MSAPRDLDLVVFGASGFVGRLLAAHLAAAAPDGLRIGLAGRSADRLDAVRAGLPERAADWPLVVADVQDAGSLAALAGRARVVATTVGPYQRHGLPLVAACATAGTDYVDLTGEVLFVRQSIDRWHTVAVESGARIVHACGFDSVPSELGVLLCAEQAAAEGAGTLEDTVLHLKAAAGGFSGGTIDSMRTQMDAVAADPALRRLVADPYSLSPDRSLEPELGDEQDRMTVTKDPELGRWAGSFVMAPFNTRIVRRSNALSGYAYGRRFRYREVVGYGRSPLAPVAAAGATAGLAGVLAGMSFGPTRAVLDRVLPAPGSGPSEQVRERGHFRIEVVARTSTGARFTATVAAKGDPGYTATAVMQGESALCLLLDRDLLPDRAGVLTPATALGLPLADRLRAQGFEIGVRRDA
jgi:short subunit dehydrogenase-like uncharacterized protein